MFNTFQEACNAISNNCVGVTPYYSKESSNPVVNTYLYTNPQATILAGTGFIVYSNQIYQVVNGKIIAVDTCPDEPGGDLQIIQQFATGLTGDSSYQIDAPQYGYAPTGEIWTNIGITISDDYRLTVSHIDLRGWAMGEPDLLFKVEIHPTWLTKNQLEAIDFSNQKGRDVFIVIGKDIGAGIKEIGYTIIHFKGDNTTDLPGFIKRESDKRMPQFVYNFPDVSLPSKFNIIEFHQLTDSFNPVASNYINKGFAVATTNNLANNWMAEYDEWAYSHGCPKANAPGAALWMRNNTIQDLYQWFRDAVINPAQNRAFVFIDFEAWGFMDGMTQDNYNKFGTLFKKMKEQNPNTVFTSYVNANPIAAKYGSGISEVQKNIENNKYTQPFSAIATGFYSKSVQYLDVNTGAFTGQTGMLGDYITPVVADYLHFINYSWLYSSIQEAELAKKWLGNDILYLNWGVNEGLGVSNGSDYESFLRYFKRPSDNYLYAHENKPPCPASYMWNVTMWGNLFTKGTWNWSEPDAYIEGYEYWGGISKYPDNSGYLPNYYSTNGGSFHYASLIGYDWTALALHKLSFNNDLLGGQIISPEFSTNNGATFYTGEDLKPASAEYSKLPVVRAIKHPTLNEWLVFAVNHHLNHYNNQIIKIKLNNKTQDLILRGQYTTVERIRQTSPDVDYSLYIKVPDYIAPEWRDTYFNKYKSMLKRIPEGVPTVHLEFPSNTISYHQRAIDGTIISSTVSLYDSNDNLIIQSTGAGSIDGDIPWGNNHGAYYLIPEGTYKVVITNDANNGLGSESWIKAETFRQDQNSPSPYYDYGAPQILELGQSKTYNFNTAGVMAQPSGLIKINSVSRA